MIPSFYIKEISEDVSSLPFIQENFILLRDFLKDQVFLNGEFKHYELVFDRAVTNLSFPHRLTFVPKDIIQTFVTEGVTVTWKYNSFDRTNIVFSTSASCTLRFFVGRYQKESGGV